MALERNQGDTAYVAIPVTADVTLGTQAVAMAFNSGEFPTTGQTKTAAWFQYVAPAPNPGWHIRILTGLGTPGGLLPLGLVTVWVKVVDNPETTWSRSSEQLYVT